jgi:hypothetical protein
MGVNSKVLVEAVNLIERINNNTLRVITNEEACLLQIKFNNCLPNWFIELISKVPLVGSEFGFQEDETEEDDISYMLWADPNTIIDESLECFPGRAIFERGYICIASCSHGSGNPFFIPINKGDNPSVYRVYHDLGDNPDIILKEGLSLISERLSDLFKKAVV